MSDNNENALDRLNRLQEPSDEREYTLEEQMDSVSTDEFLDGMSLSAKNQMHHFAEEVKMDNEVEELKTENEELFNNNTENEEKHKRQYRKRDKSGSVEDSGKANDTSSNPIESNPVFDQVAKDLIDDLRKSNYKINRFDDKSMSMIFDYMYSKF